MAENEPGVTANPCMVCGACCAIYKITFSTTETADEPGGTVPPDLTLPEGLSKRTMKGTEKGSKRCVALAGCVGQRVNCTIYSQRPSPCRNFKAAWQQNETNDQCNWARAVYGLPPFCVI